jgi:chromosomal replication initiator protein
MLQTRANNIIEWVDETISKVSGVSVQNIRGISRDKDIVLARHVVWMILHDYKGFTYSRLGREYERDHTTIINGVNRVRREALKLVAELKKEYPILFIEKGRQPGDGWDL